MALTATICECSTRPIMYWIYVRTLSETLVKYSCTLLIAITQLK